MSMNTNSKARRRSLAVCAGAMCAVPAVAQQEAAQAAPQPAYERPNIVFILADDLGYGDLSCYGSRHVLTPNIDGLAATGTAFTQCYAGSGISSPSRCALMTGKNTGNTTIRDNQCTANGMVGLKISPKGDTTYVRRANLLPRDTTIATVLSAAGYRTCLVNKWHLDGYDPTAAPNHRGFHEFYGWTISTVESNSPYYYPYYRFHGDSLIHIEENANGRHARHNNDISTEDALGFIERNRHRPFFLYLAYDAPHEPYIIDETDWYDGHADWTDSAKRYASLITHMDRAIGRVIHALDSLGLRERTLVIFASDNGPAVQAPLEQFNCSAGFRGRKGQLYEGGIRVPMIVNYPGHVPARRVDNAIYFPDMMPTLAELAGAEEHLPQGLGGMSVLPLMMGDTLDTSKRLLYWEFPGKQRAARRGDWKCVTVKAGKPLELYNLKDDPGERHNLADEMPDMVRQFDEDMRAIRTPSPYWPIADD